MISQPGVQTSWVPKASCTSTPSTTLSDCGVVTVKVTDSGVTTDKSNVVKVAMSPVTDEILVIFDPVLSQVALNTRTVEIVLASGAFVTPADPNSLAINMRFETPPKTNANTRLTYFDSQLQAKIYNYRGVNFVGGSGSTGSMPAILASQNSNLPANAFTKSGFTFSGWACSDGGEVAHSDQSRLALLTCSTLYALWTPVGGGSGGGSNGSSGSTPSDGSGSRTPAATAPPTLAATGSEGHPYLLTSLLLTLAGLSLYGVSVSARRKQS